MLLSSNITGADSIERPLTAQSQINAELINLVTAVWAAEGAFDALDHHIDPARSELLTLLNRLRLGNNDFRNKLPIRYHRPGLRFTSPELASLLASRDWLCSTPSGRAVRAIVAIARNRYPSKEASPLPDHPLMLSFTESELIDLADAWAELPFNFESKLKEVKEIHDAAKQRQQIQSGFAMMRAARAFIESAQRGAARSGLARRFTQEEVHLADVSLQRLHGSVSVQSARRVIDHALERYDETLATNSAPIGLLLSSADLDDLNQRRNDALISLEQDLHQLRLRWKQPTTAMRVLSETQTTQDTPLRYAVRFDGRQSATTTALSGLQFWCELLLESYYLPLPFNVVVLGSEFRSIHANTCEHRRT